jgi:hypothetical protein
MQLIKPSEVSGKIMTLIEESENRLILISPYVRISKWYKLKNKIIEAQNRKVPIEFYIRKDKDNDKKEVLSLGIIPIEIQNLHCKIYINDKIAIVTSLNLLLNSEINSLEIGYITENIKEYKEIIDFYSMYISGHGEEELEKIENCNHWLDLIYDKLNKECKRLRIRGNDNEVEINTGTSTYNIFIQNKGKDNYLKINGILSKKEFENIKDRKIGLIKETELNIELKQGEKGFYDTILGESKESLYSKSINDLKKVEYILVSELVYKFISNIDKIKKSI